MNKNNNKQKFKIKHTKITTSTFHHLTLNFFSTILEIIKDTNNKTETRIKIVISVKLSNKLVPIYPQKYTITLFPINKAKKNFSFVILDNPAAILIKKAGENGIAINKTKLEKEILEIVFIILSKPTASFFLIKL